MPSSDGFAVATWSAVPDQPRGVVVLCHGLTTGADDDGPFLPLRDRLLGRGLAVVRFDARCHGETGGDWRRLSLAGWRDDVAAVIRHARGLADAPLLLLSASFSAGPAIAAVLDGATDCAGIVFWNPVLDYPRTFLSHEFPAGAEVVATRGAPGLPAWASYELPGVSVPLSDSLVAEMHADETPRRAALLPCPGLVVHGTGDPFVNISINREIAAASPPLRLRTIPIARHGFRWFRPLVRAISTRWLARAAEGGGSAAPH